MIKHLSQRSDVDVWQTNHVGGHRFAANVLCLPAGVLYGRVTAQAADDIVNADRNQLVLTDHFRGRTSLDPVVQAAEYYVRVQLNNSEPYDLQVSTSQVITDTITKVAATVRDQAIVVETLVTTVPAAALVVKA